MVIVLFALAGIVLLALAGFNVRGPRFAPEWFGLAFLAVAVFANELARLGGF